MLDVASLQQFDFFSNFKLYAGSNGIYRTISNVVILDHEGFENDFSDFHEGDFVITNLLYAKDHPERIYSSFKNLIPIGISAIAIKSIFFHDLPDDVVALAEKYAVPIYFFNSIYIEDVILNIVDYLRTSSNYSYFDKLIHSILHTEDNKSMIRQFLDDCSKDDLHYVSSLYLTYQDSIDEISIQRNLNQILHKKSSLSYSKDLFCVKYKKGILILNFYSQQITSEKVQQDWKYILYDLEILLQDFYIGIFDNVLASNNLDIAIQRCIYANQYCTKNKFQEMKYTDMHLQNVLLTIASNRYTNAYLMELYHAIQAEERNSSNHLFDTLVSCVQCRFQIEKTAKQLFQHPNTVRYRLNKIKIILQCKDDFEFQILAALIVENSMHCTF